jgi:hypothetical protein
MVMVVAVAVAGVIHLVAAVRLRCAFCRLIRGARATGYSDLIGARRPLKIGLRGTARV